jgi:hypothetical protein
MPRYGQSLEAKSQVWKVTDLAVTNRPGAQRDSRVVGPDYRNRPQLQQVPDSAYVVGVMVSEHNRG